MISCMLMTIKALTALSCSDMKADRDAIDHKSLAEYFSAVPDRDASDSPAPHPFQLDGSQEAKCTSNFFLLFGGAEPLTRVLS